MFSQNTLRIGTCGAAWKLGPPPPPPSTHHGHHVVAQFLSSRCAQPNVKQQNQPGDGMIASRRQAFSSSIQHGLQTTDLGGVSVFCFFTSRPLTFMLFCSAPRAQLRAARNGRRQEQTLQRLEFFLWLGAKVGQQPTAVPSASRSPGFSGFDAVQRETTTQTNINWCHDESQFMRLHQQQLGFFSSALSHRGRVPLLK